MVDEASSELSDAFRRVQNDQRERTFFTHPCNVEVLTVHRSEWLAELQRRVDDSKYTPRPAPLLSIAKENWHVRPGVVLTLDDQVVYQYLALLARPVVAPQLEWSEGKVRFSHYLSKSGASGFQRPFLGWKNFSHASIKKLKDASKYVVITDIAGYYENIDIGRLIQDLRASGVSSSVTELLSACLNKWAGPRARGIPQGNSASDLFGEFYLNSVDRTLATEGFEHARYSDDFRVFADSQVNAIKALHRLSELLRERGLNIQTAKSDILDAADARQRFTKVGRVLADVSQRIGGELEDLVGTDPYITPAALRKYIRSDPNDPAPAVVEAAWHEFEAGEFGQFNRSVFHYLISRLAELRSDAAVPYAITQLRERPEETRSCLRYLESLLDDLDESVFDKVAGVLTDGRNVFQHQKYQLLQWFWKQQLPNERVRTFCRRQLTAHIDSPFVLPYAAVYLGEFADGLHDYEKLESAFFRDSNELTRAAYLYALRSAPKDIRRRVFGRAKGESTYLDWTIDVAQQRSCQ